MHPELTYIARLRREELTAPAPSLPPSSAAPGPRAPVAGSAAAWTRPAAAPSAPPSSLLPPPREEHDPAGHDDNVSPDRWLRAPGRSRRPGAEGGSVEPITHPSELVASAPCSAGAWG